MEWVWGTTWVSGGGARGVSRVLLMWSQSWEPELERSPLCMKTLAVSVRASARVRVCREQAGIQ